MFGLNMGEGADSIHLPFRTLKIMKTPDVEGVYTAQLIVFNEYGQASDPCITSIEVTPPEDPCVDPQTAYDLHPEAQLMLVDNTLPLNVQFLDGTAGYTIGL